MDIGKTEQELAMAAFPCPPEYKLLASMGSLRLRRDHGFAKTFVSFFLLRGSVVNLTVERLHLRGGNRESVLTDCKTVS